MNRIAHTNSQGRKKLLIFSLFSHIFIARGSVAGPLQSDLNQILKSYDNSVSLSVRSLAGEEVAQINGTKMSSPASVAKMLSSACALSELGPHFQFESFFGFTGKIEGSTLKGNLIVSGTGDPSFVNEDLKEVIEKLRYLHGIKKIEGKLIFDTSYLTTPILQFAEDTFKGDSGRAFTAQITATPVNFNAFSAWAAFDLRGNATRTALLPQDSLDLRIVNQLKVSNSQNASITFDPAKKLVVLSGTVADKNEARGFYRSVPDPYNYFYTLFKNNWSIAGGEWTTPQFEIKNTRIESKLLWRHPSRSLNHILIDINKSSLNFGAEMISLAAGVKRFGAPASFDKSQRMLSECLQKFAVKKESMRLANASGLSRDSLMQSSALTKFLASYASSPYAPEYLSSFSLLGMDGTTRSRLKTLAGQARLKTGSIDQVRSIAGYLYPKNKSPLVFAMFINGPKAEGPMAIETENKILKLLLEN